MTDGMTKGRGKGEPGFFTITLVMFLIWFVMIGPANLVLFFKSPIVYSIVIGLVIGLFIMRKIG